MKRRGRLASTFALAKPPNVTIGSCIVALALAGEPPSSDDGIGLLATGGLLAGIGMALAAVPMQPVTCGASACDRSLSTADIRGIVSPAAFVLSSPFLAVGMHRLQLARLERELAEARSTPGTPRRANAPRRLALFGGIVGMVAGGALLGTSVALVRTPFADAARWIGGPTLVGGALLTGTATAHRRVHAQATTFAPLVSRTSAGISIARRF